MSPALKPLAAVGALLICTSIATAGTEEHFDVWLQVDGSSLWTGAIGEDGDPIASNWRVFGAEFGEDPQFPFSADEPGFQMDDGSVDPFHAFQINIVDSVTRWNGDGFDDALETISLEFGPESVTSGDGYVAGFEWTADGEGGFHDHFGITIDGDGGDPVNGVYLLPLSISSNLAGPMSETEPFWFVMNLGMDEDAHDAAMDWVQDNLVPAPSAAALLALGVFARRRRI